MKAGKLVAASGKVLGEGGVTISGGSLEVTADNAVLSQSKTDTNATISQVTGGNNQLSTSKIYSLGSDGHQVKNARVEISSTNAKTISNRFVNVDLVNNGAGTLSAGNGFNDFTSISANIGDITLKGLAAEAKNGNVDTVSSLTLGAGRTLSVYTNWDASALTEATVKVAEKGVASFGAGAKMIGNLVLSNGVKLTLDGALTMGSTLTLGTGIVLDNATLASINALTAGDSPVTLFEGVDSLVLGTATYREVAFSAHFAGVTNNDVYLGYDGQNVFAGIQSVPEPTTATLSLLALAGLAARRRRK